MSPADYRALRNNSWDQEPVSDPEARRRILEDQRRRAKRIEVPCSRSQEYEKRESEDLSRITDMAVRF